MTDMNYLDESERIQTQMDKNDVFKAVQDLMRTPPLFLIGTGGSIPYGLPGMTKLATHLKTALTPKYNKLHGQLSWIVLLMEKILKRRLLTCFYRKKFEMI